jgi:heme A synthase
VPLIDVHALLGLIILGLAHYNNVLLKRSAAPNRLKRITKATAILATIQIILGLILYANVRLGFTVPLVDVVIFLHILIALAIITQASSVATAYDMWEEHEFDTSKA